MSKITTASAPRTHPTLGRGGAASQQTTARSAPPAAPEPAREGPPPSPHVHPRHYATHIAGVVVVSSLRLGLGLALAVFCGALIGGFISMTIVADAIDAQTFIAVGLAVEEVDGVRLWLGSGAVSGGVGYLIRCVGR